MKYDAIISDLRKKVYRPVYFLQGDEPYYIDLLSDYIEKHVLSGMEKEFNQTIVYGRDVDVLSLVSMAKRYPMMSDRQVVIVKEAQEIKGLIPKKNSKDESPLIPYLKQPQPTTLLVLCHKNKTIDKRTKLAKAFAKHAVVFDSARLYDSKIPAWIAGHVSKKGFKIKDDACLLLSEFIGNDLSRIVHELDKLFLNVERGGQIDMSLIEQYIGISKEFNVFELQKALGQRDLRQANRIAMYMSSNEKSNPTVLTLGSLHSYFNKLMTYHYLQDKSERQAASALGVPPFFIREYSAAARQYKPEKIAEIFSLLRECDMKTKGVRNDSAPPGELVRELIYKILH